MPLRIIINTQRNGQDAPWITGGNHRPEASSFVGEWKNPDMVRTLASGGRGTKLHPVCCGGRNCGEIEMPQEIPDKTQAKIIAELHRTVRHLLEVEGCSVPEILVSICAETVSQMTGFFGGKVTAEICELAAKRVVCIPSDPFIAADAAGARRVLQ